MLCLLLVTFSRGRSDEGARERGHPPGPPKARRSCRALRQFHNLVDLGPSTVPYRIGRRKALAVSGWLSVGARASPQNMGNATSSSRADDGDVDGIDKPSIPGESVPELRGGETELRLSVYKVNKPDQDKFCAMHTAIVIRQPGTSVLGEEYAFSPDGLLPPTEADPDSSLTFCRHCRSASCGVIQCGLSETSKIVREWEEKPYDAINANCYHLRDICWRLSSGHCHSGGARSEGLLDSIASEQPAPGTKEVHDDLEHIMELALGLGFRATTRQSLQIRNSASAARTH